MLRRALLILTMLAFATPATANAQSCGSSNIDGDHITQANDFQVSGGLLTCATAFLSATGWTDSAAGAYTTTPGTETFAAELYEWRYRWTCRTTELPVLHKGLGAYFHCHAREELGGHTRGIVYMSFKWWLSQVKSCVRGEEEISATRNASCHEAFQWVETASSLIPRWVYPYASHEGKQFYHYYQSETGDGTGPEGFLYDCWDRSLPEEEGHTDQWSCTEAGRKFDSREYTWAESDEGHLL
jgi:hypothetical protein